MSKFEFCYLCDRPLKRPASQYWGMGPKCAKKFLKIQSAITPRGVGVVMPNGVNVLEEEFHFFKFYEAHLRGE
jgi:hypothetical protein